MEEQKQKPITTEEVKTIIKTSDYSPVQLEGRLKSGKMFYFRYKHDRLIICVSKMPTKSIYDALNGDEVYRFDSVTGDPDCGTMSDEDAMSYMKKVFKISHKVFIQ